LGEGGLSAGGELLAGLPGHVVVALSRAWRGQPKVAGASFWEEIIQSRSWKFVLIVFYASLTLFGPQFRDMYMVEAGYRHMDVIFMCALMFFTLDDTVEIDVEPKNFSFDLFCWRGERRAQVIAKDGWDVGATDLVFCFERHIHVDLAPREFHL
jgi:hypothetical protein